MHLALPVDVLNQDLAPGDDLLRPLLVPTAQAPAVPMPDAGVLANVAALLSGRKPVIVVGRRAKGGGREIEALAEALDAPVVAAIDGKGVVDERHPYYLGVLGIFGHPGVAATRRVVETADTVLAFGADNLKPFVTDSRNVRAAATHCVRARNGDRRP